MTHYSLLYRRISDRRPLTDSCSIKEQWDKLLSLSEYLGGQLARMDEEDVAAWTGNRGICLSLVAEAALHILNR